MNQVLEKILKSGCVNSPDGKVIKLHSNISKEEGVFLMKIIDELKPKVTLEVGLAYGISALFICQALEKYRNVRHIIMDPSQNKIWGGIGLYNLREAGYQEIIDFHEQPSQLFLPQLENNGVKIDFAFIDGWHTFDHTLVDFFYIDKLLNVGGVVVFDDSTWPSVSKVIRYVLKNRSYTVFRCFKSDSFKYKIFQTFQTFKNMSAIGIGTCVALKKESEDKRKWNYHQNF